MSNTGKILITESDFQNIAALAGTLDSKARDLLEEELGRAVVVCDADLPGNVVRMNSKVSFEDVESGKFSNVTLVYPNEMNITDNKISVLAPVGSALIGLSVGQTIHWPLPNGKQRILKVISVD